MLDTLDCGVLPTKAHWLSESGFRDLVGGKVYLELQQRTLSAGGKVDLLIGMH